MYPVTEHGRVTESYILQSPVYWQSKVLVKDLDHDLDEDDHEGSADDDDDSQAVVTIVHDITLV